MLRDSNRIGTTANIAPTTRLMGFTCRTPSTSLRYVRTANANTCQGSMEQEGPGEGPGSTLEEARRN